jgi:hypothetical protein
MKQSPPLLLLISAEKSRWLATPSLHPLSDWQNHQQHSLIRPQKKFHLLLHHRLVHWHSLWLDKDLEQQAVYQFAKRQFGEWLSCESEALYCDVIPLTKDQQQTNWLCCACPSSLLAPVLQQIPAKHILSCQAGTYWLASQLTQLFNDHFDNQALSVSYQEHNLHLHWQQNGKIIAFSCSSTAPSTKLSPATLHLSLNQTFSDCDPHLATRLSPWREHFLANYHQEAP